MEPHFIINVGGLDKLGFTEKEFLELLDIDFENAVQTSEEIDFGCPKCNRCSEDSFFIYHQYKDFRFGKNQGYSFINIRYHLCICGCLYVFLSRNEKIEFEKEDEAKEQTMDNTGVVIKKSYAFTFQGGPGGHVSLTNDGRAVLVYLHHTNGRIDCKIFTDQSDKTAESQAKKYVWENIDEKAEFFEDPFLDLCNWLLQNT